MIAHNLFLASFGLTSVAGAHPSLPHLDSAIGSELSVDDVGQIVEAMGGADALRDVHAVQYRANHIYRSSTLTQTYSVRALDQSVATAGSQIMSFKFDDSGLHLRTDRAYMYNEYWAWAQPDLHPFINMSMVVHDTSEPYACFVRGQNSFYADDPSVALGYADGLLTDYLVHHARQFALPWLLQRFLSDTASLRKYSVQDPTSLANYTAIEQHRFGLAILIDKETQLPHAIRSHEHHTIYGPSSSDLVLSMYRNVTTKEGHDVLMPHRYQTVYNTRFVLEDFLVDSMTLDPEYSPSFFEGRAASSNPQINPNFVGLNPQGPVHSPEYSRSEVHAYFETGLWGGPFDDMFNVSDVVVEFAHSHSEKIMIVYVGYPDYVQLLVEHDNGFIVTDAPAHRSKLILEWLRQHKPGKNVTHVVPSHHHSDHADGVYDYIAAGATLVLPAVANDFYIQGGQKANIETYDEAHPFEFKDNSINFRSYWRANNPHAEDWTFAVASDATAQLDSPAVVFNADVVNPGTPALRGNAGAARDFLSNAVKVGVPRSALLVGAHGSTRNGTSTTELLTNIAEVVGFKYPEL